ADAGRVDAGLIGGEAHSAAAHQMNAVGEQDVDPGTRFHRFGRDRRHLRDGATATCSSRDGTHSTQQSEQPVHLRILVGIVTMLAAGSAACAPAPNVAPVPVTSNVDRLLDSLPLRERIAQLVMPWIPGSYAALDEPGFARARMWVDSLRVGGIIVSVGSPLDIAARLNALQAASPLPLLVASDLESGTPIRLNGGTWFPPNMGVGAGGRELDAYEVGRVTALEGLAVGIHLAFAP